MRLDLGCGANKRKGFTGIDIEDYSHLYPKGEFIQNDLNKGIPFTDNSVDEIYSYHFLEHIDDFQSMMKEIYRICKNRAIVVIYTPHRSVFGDEEDKRPFNYYSFTYNSVDCPNRLNPKKKMYKVLKREFKCAGFYRLFNFMNYMPYLYEQTFLRNLILCKEIKFVLEILK